MNTRAWSGCSSIVATMSANRCWSLPGLVLLVGCALAACGSDDGVVAASDESPSSAPSAEASTSPGPDSGGTNVPTDAPACADVWEAGAKLPRTYAGCVEGEGYAKRDVLECSSGQRIVRYGDEFWAALGGTIKQAETTPLRKDPAYIDFVVDCRA